MRSLIKMQVSKYPNFDVVPINQLPFKQQNLRHYGIASYHTNRNSILKKNSIFQPSQINKSQLLSQHWQQKQKIDQKNLRKKVSIQKYISDLNADIQNSKNQPDLGQTKLKVLKRIIQHYDIKTMQKNHYSKLIKTFGLQIQPVQTQRKEIKSHNTNRNFKIKNQTKKQSRLSFLRNKIQEDITGQVVLLEFSKQLKPSTRHSSFREKKAESQNYTERYSMKQKQKYRINLTYNKDRDREKSIKQTINLKKVSPFKYTSSQDMLIEKINKYRQFLFILNTSNHLYRNMSVQNYQTSLKFYIGPGNNSNLVKSLLKKRFYFQETNDIKEANFIWTQIKIDEIFSRQNNSSFDSLESRKKIIQKKQPLRKLSTNTQLQQSLSKILTKNQTNLTLKIHDQISRKLSNISFQDRLKYYNRKFNMLQILPKDQVHNHLPSNGLLGNKKGMFYCLRQYYKITGRNVWDILPLTFHISKGVLDNDFKQFNNYYNQRKKNKLSNIWIMKPGEFSNRGNGITCSNKLDQIRKRVSKCHVGRNGEAKTLILQLYISNPLLYNNRKFDIRAYMLVTCHNGKIKGYWYHQGYVRTSSYFFDLNQLTDSDIHLTNDAIQKKSDKYGKFQPGNKLSYSQLQRYLDTLTPNGRNLDLYTNALPKMKQIAAQSLMSSFMFLDENKKQNNFQIFGLDFMLDYNLKPWLIEINTNPCLELSCPLLQRIIPHMVQNAFRIGLDTIFPPPNYVPHNYKYIIAQNAIHYNKFQLIFDEDRDGPQVRQSYQTYPGSIALIFSLMTIKQDQQVFQQQGIICDYDI